MSNRATWTSRVGFLVAAIGSAVGLGNIWQFPFKTAANGGAAFVVFYLLAVLLLGFPALLAEFAIGRRTKANAIDAFEEMGHRSWRVVGALSVLTGFWILSYYDVVGGWVLRYMIGSATGAYFDAPGQYFGTIASGPEAILGQAVFIGLVVGIVALGVADGIERATKVMVPSIVLLMIGLAAWAFTLGGAAEGYAYFLSPDFGDLLANAPSVIPYAVSQAFFTLSLGMAIMITYASYVGEDDSLAVDGGVIVVSNTLIGVLAGLVVFPIMFAIGADPTQTTTDALFVAVASAFAQLPLGNLLGVVFFGVVLMAALSSAISLLEVLVAYAADNYDVARTRLAVAAGVLLFLLGLPSAWDTAWFGWFDAVAYNLFLPLSVLFVVIFVSWVIGREAVDELRRGTTGAGRFGSVWLWTTRIVVLVGILVTLAFGVNELFLAENAAFFAPF
ncbi:sodium-dependent transporter [Halomicrobium salinisoli]|uniref:sodium-dependent transporter n=1 Tax=Halomicrobium salinisoli TaxID=2878391 RepID=UPI001CF0C121|nr:sodium-dependent transporter [Halomicrobium salinisoli]